MPTEAEWEKAARGGLEGAIYPWGDSPPVCEKGAQNGAKFDDNANCNDTGQEQVGSYGPNEYGIYDMVGNVEEWVSSIYRRYPYSATDGREDMSAGSADSYRALRGGAWNGEAFVIRSAYRRGISPWRFQDQLGFRCAQDVE